MLFRIVVCIPYNVYIFCVLKSNNILWSKEDKPPSPGALMPNEEILAHRDRGDID
jgi:hypothetical protein